MKSPTCPCCGRYAPGAWGFLPLPKQVACLNYCPEDFEPAHVPFSDRIHCWLWIKPLSWFYVRIFGRIDTWLRILLCWKLAKTLRLWHGGQLKAEDFVKDLEDLQRFSWASETFAHIIHYELLQAHRQAARKNV